MRGEIILHFSHYASRGTARPLHFEFAFYTYATTWLCETWYVGLGTMIVKIANQQKSEVQIINLQVYKAKTEFRETMVHREVLD